MAGCGRQQNVHAEPTPDAGIPWVAVARAVRTDFTRSLTLTGELMPFQEVEVMAKVAGYVKSIQVDVGDRVRQGQVLAVLEVPEMRDDWNRAAAAIQRNLADVRRAEDEAARAETAHRIAHLTHERLANVAKVQPGLVAQQEIDDVLAKDQVAEAQVAAAQSAMAAAREQIRVAEAEKSKVETLLEYSRVTAPFAGIVTRRYANNGSMIQAGVASQSQAMPVVRLSQHDLLRLVLPVPESAAGAVKAGSIVEVRVPSLNRAFPGRVARTSDQVETSTRTMHTEVDVPNPQRMLIPGMYAEVTLPVEWSKGAVAVPLTALDGAGTDATVLVVLPGGVLERRRVTTGLESPAQMEVRTGLTVGETVVAAGGRQLKPGQRVKAAETNPAEGSGAN